MLFNEIVKHVSDCSVAYAHHHGLSLRVRHNIDFGNLLRVLIVIISGKCSEIERGPLLPVKR